ncbi:MAG: hypothetical protein KDC27_01910 [Acidobacteria bacterium]|nr:hypothetical protein [Acidobacteriota bacterium]
MSSRSIAVRLFWSCWLLYTLHFATNIVRDLYLAVAIGDHSSFRVDEYAGMHPDLFEHPGHGWHTGGNPGSSMIAAIPYAAARPAISAVARRVNESRKASGRSEPPAYASPWPMAREMYGEAWRRGLDVKLGLAAFAAQAGAMAPISAAGVALMFLFLERTVGNRRAAFVLALLYGFATPVFFRTGTLNHNVMAAQLGFGAFCALGSLGRRRDALAGALAGTCVLLDYSGVFVAAPLGMLCLWQADRDGASPLAAGVKFAGAAVGPVLLLWWYQWCSFGHPFYPGQHWMPKLGWIEETGFRGLNLPQWRWAWRLWLDPAYGLLPSCPLFVAALWPGPAWRALGAARTLCLYGVTGGLWLFLSGLDYNAIQDNTGIRYMAPAFPFLFVAAAFALGRMPRAAAVGLAGASLLVNWCLAMFRDVERGRGVLDPLLDLFADGPALPALTTLARIEGPWAGLAGSPWTALALYAVVGGVVWAIWRPMRGSCKQNCNQAQSFGIEHVDNE